MPDIFEVQERASEVLSLLTYQPNEYKKAQAVARLRQWLMETNLEIARFESDMERQAEEHYQMKIMEGGLLKW